MATFAGICGTSGRPCKLVWASNFPGRVKYGTYPSELLPSRRTIWHASAGGGYDYPPAGTALGGTGGGGSISGLGIVDAFAGLGIFGTDIQIYTWRPKTQVTVVFARTEYRINIPHVLTRSEVESADPNTGEIELDLGEYIFEAVAAVDPTYKESIDELWQGIQDETNKAEGEGDVLTDDYGQKEEKEDRNFRKLIEAIRDIPDEQQRLEGIIRNKTGIEYRLDNGGPKSTTIFDLPGLGDLNSPTYRDGSSRKIGVNITASKTDEGRLDVSLAPGTIVYLTYIAIKEHYIRQVVNVSWSFLGQSLPPQCYPLSVKVKAANYRFYEWEVANDDPQGLPIIVGGWRAVESFNMPVNLAALVPPFNDANIAEFGYGPASGLTKMTYLPTDVTDSELNGFIDNRGTFPSYNLIFNEDDVDGAKYLIPADDEYKKSNWYLSGVVSKLNRYTDITRHDFYNVHPKALKKRDVDKFAIERSLAQAVETDVGAGKQSFFPFLDDESVNDLTTDAINFLDASNTRFEPIQPISSAFFGEMQCGSVGGTVLFPSGGPSPNGDVVTFFQIESPIITEKFAKETRVLVERNFTTGQVDPAVVAIEGAAGEVDALSCIGDPSDHFAYTVHSNEGFLQINNFHNEYIEDGMRVLTYRPDQPNPLTADNLNPVPSEYDRFVGFSGMLGDQYGYKPGRYLSLSQYAPKNAFLYKSTAKDKLARILDVDEGDIGDLIVKHEDGVIDIDLGGPGFYGITEIEYIYKGDSNIDVLMRLKNGESLSGIVDEIDIVRGNHILRIDHRWMQGSKLEIVEVPEDNFELIRVTVNQLAESYADDLLRNDTSSTVTDAAGSLTDRLADRSVLIETDIMSIGEDGHSRLFVFFNDKENGISCLESDDFGISWYFHYGIIEQIFGYTALNPFVVHSFYRNKCWVFFQFMGGKIMCKQIDYDLFDTQDANLIEKTEDVLQAAENQAAAKAVLGLGEGGTALVELPSLYTENGQQMRRKTVSHIAAGDLTDAEFLNLTGRDGESYESQENRLKQADDGSETVVVNYKSPIAIGSSTAFTNKDIEDIYFSAYRKLNGEMKLFFIAPTKPGGDLMLQSRFSGDDGINWYDLWEYIEFGYDRLRFDRDRKTQFINTTAGAGRGSTSGTDPIESGQDAEFGINLHWSRLKKHKIGGEEDLNVESDSEVLPISAPYAFYHNDTDTVFLFYIYEGCLLCKRFADHVFDQAASNRDATGGDVSETPMDGLKKSLEKRLRANFVDGELNSIKEEVHLFYNKETNERLLEGNIIFPYPQTIETFDDNRRVPDQRVCAYALRNGNIRVFYKNDDKELKAALWDGRIWMPEDLMRDASELEAFDFESWDDADGVIGGFGDEKFKGSAGGPSGTAGSSSDSGDTGSATG